MPTPRNGNHDLILKPRDLVRSVSYGVDFGVPTYKPGDVAIICPTDFKPEWFLVHWADGYTCNVGRDDVRKVPDHLIGRIVGKPLDCGVCAERQAKGATTGGIKREDLIFFRAWLADATQEKAAEETNTAEGGDRKAYRIGKMLLNVAVGLKPEGGIR